MFWAFVLPFKIATLLSLGLIPLVYTIARRRRSGRAGAVGLGALIAGVAFLPLGMMAYSATYAMRFGKFTAPSTAEVRSEQVKCWLPPEATNIAMITTTHDHYVRFEVSDKHLIAWMEKLWKIAGSRAPMSRAESAFGKEAPAGDDPELAELGMDPIGRYQLFEGPYASNWGGPTLWYDPVTETAWQSVGYW